MGQQSATGRIASLYVNRDGNFICLNLDGPTLNASDCGAAEFYVIEFPAAGSSGPLPSSLYLAYAQPQPITMWISGYTATSCWGATRPLSFDVYLAAV